MARRLKPATVAKAVSAATAIFQAIPQEQREHAIAAARDAAGRVTVPNRLSPYARLESELDAIEASLDQLDADPERAASTAEWRRRLRALRAGLPLAKVARSSRRQLRELAKRTHELQDEVFAVTITPEVVVPATVRVIREGETGASAGTAG